MAPQSRGLFDPGARSVITMNCHFDQARQDQVFKAMFTHHPRGVDRGSMITEATEDEITIWLHKHGFVE
jgi:hypothetical protein